MIELDVQKIVPFATMQNFQSNEFNITTRFSDAGNIFADLYFSKNPLAWKHFEDQQDGIHTTTLVGHDRFRRVKLLKHVNASGEEVYAGAILGGIGVEPEHEFSSEQAEQYFARVMKQRAQWLRYEEPVKEEKSIGSESIERHIAELITLRSPMDWKFRTEHPEPRSEKAKVQMLTGFESGTKVTLKKLSAPGKEDAYIGTCSGILSGSLDQKDAKKFFEQIHRHGSQSIKAEAKLFVKNDLLSVVQQIAKDFWTVSNRWTRADDAGEHIGYSFMAAGAVLEGRNSCYISINAVSETVAAQCKFSIKLERNGHSHVVALHDEQLFELLDVVCDTCKLKKFHRMTDLTLDDVNARQKV